MHSMKIERSRGATIKAFSTNTLFIIIDARNVSNFPAGLKRTQNNRSSSSVVVASK
jgi:hypothetical protein